MIEENWNKEELLKCLYLIREHHQNKPTLFFNTVKETLGHEFDALGLNKKWWKPNFLCFPLSFDELLNTYIREGQTEIAKALPPKKGIKAFHQSLQDARKTWIEIERRQKRLETLIEDLQNQPKSTIKVPKDVDAWLNLDYQKAHCI